MNTFELLPEGSAPASLGWTALVWPRSPGTSASIKADVDPWLTQFGDASEAAIDLVRIAVGAYFADRLSRRGAGYSRTIGLHVRLVEPKPWEALGGPISDLLHWLTGDTWQITLSADGLERAFSEPKGSVAGAHSVALFSGGLDSLCGALLQGGEPSLLLGHWDNTLVKGAQDRAYSWLRDTLDSAPAYRQINLAQMVAKRDPSSRSRSLLFLALAVAAAEGLGAANVVVPENGFTSLNPPLGPERGGVLSTRSTHPSTIYRVNQVLSKLGSDVQIENPYAWATKGELVRAASETCDTDFGAGAAATLSCGKLDGRVYKGGDSNQHCGLCVPCLVRRASLAAGAAVDETPYLCNTLSGDSLTKLRNRRANDVNALRRTLAEPFEDTALMSLGPFPPAFDPDAAYDLCLRGFRELQLVQLP